MVSRKSSKKRCGSASRQQVEDSKCFPGTDAELWNQPMNSACKKVKSKCVKDYLAKEGELAYWDEPAKKKRSKKLSNCKKKSTKKSSNGKKKATKKGTSRGRPSKKKGGC